MSEPNKNDEIEAWLNSEPAVSTSPFTLPLNETSSRHITNSPPAKSASLKIKSQSTEYINFNDLKIGLSSDSSDDECEENESVTSAGLAEFLAGSGGDSNKNPSLPSISDMDIPTVHEV